MAGDSCPDPEGRMGRRGNDGLGRWRMKTMNIADDLAEWIIACVSSSLVCNSVREGGRVRGLATE